MPQRSELLSHPHFDHSGFGPVLFFESPHFTLLNLTVPTFVMAAWPYAQKKRRSLLGFVFYLQL